MTAGSRAAAADYYRSLTSLYRWYGTTAHGWHYGLHDTGSRGHAASLTRTNEFLLEGLGPAGDLLDVGCGEGGFSVFAAASGWRSTGITLCLEHLHLAQTLAQSRAVDRRCRFLLADMDALPFAPGSFDVIVNQETWCHSQFKSVYLEQVWQLLRPGGVFRAVDLAIADGTPSPRAHRQYKAVREGFQVPSLPSPALARQALADAGFEGVAVRDLTPAVKRSAWLILAFSAGPHLLTKTSMDRWLYGGDARIAGHYRRHVAACMAFNLGLLSGAFRYLYVTGRKPRC